MIGLLEHLKITEYKEYVINDIKCVSYNFNDDKLLLALKTSNLNDVSLVTSGLLEMLEEFRRDIINEVNISDSLLNKNNLSMFLWDIYVICFYPEINLSDTEETQIHKLEKDKYMARKIVINYNEGNLDDMKEKYTKLIFPEKYLNQTKINEIDVKNSIAKIDIEKYKDEIKKIEDFLNNQEERI